MKLLKCVAVNEIETRKTFDKCNKTFFCEICSFTRQILSECRHYTCASKKADENDDAKVSRDTHEVGGGCHMVCKCRQQG